jgi:hypothetical protein
MKRYVDMLGTNTEKLKAKLVTIKAKGGSQTLKKLIPGVASLDNGKINKGFAFEVRPNGLVMVQIGNCDLGVQLPNISKV